MSLEAFGDENPYTNGPMKECPDCEGYAVIKGECLVCKGVGCRECCNGCVGVKCGTCSGTGEVYDEYEPCEGDVL